MKISDIVKKQKEFYNSNVTKNVDYRIKTLKKLKESIIKNQDKISMALKKDLNKSEFESYMSEIGIVLSEINYTLKNIKKWSKTKRVKSTLTQLPAKCYSMPESYGVVLIMATWNYPFLLCIQPLISAVAAGNCAIIKTSRFANATSDVIVDIIIETFSSQHVAVIKGGLEECKQLLEEKFDYIFFTGSYEVGKIVMEKASRNLTPVTLELGGKSPCIVDETANLELAAKRIVFGKILNAGQTCVAPDYLLVNSKIKQELIKNIKKYIKIFLGDNAINNPDYPNIINLNHVLRLQNLIKDESIILGGKVDQKRLKIEPTLIDKVKLDSPVMSEEIFGPILPIISYKKIDEVINIVKHYEKPLALYLFTNSKQNEEKILNQLSFGGGCVNDTIMHLASTYLQFGGVGGSGMGSYHGKNGFDTFTHYKSVLKQSNIIDLPIRYHKYTDKKLKLIKKVLK